MKLFRLAGLVFLFYALPARAIEPFVIKDIRVEGIQRTEAGTVFSYLPVKVGETIDDKKSAEAIHALYATGIFKDVRLEVDRGVLVVVVSERPTIASVKFNGISDIPQDQLKDGLKSAGLAEGRIFDQSLLDKSVQELKRQYVARGKYGVTVTVKVSDLARNRVSVVFDVVEGDVSKIKQINIVGNKAYKEDDLLALMKLSTPDWISWFSKNDQYSKQKLSADIETMRSTYLDNGYLEFTIDSTQVSITPDKKDIYITVNITEGPKYTVSKVEVSGNTLIAKEQIEKLIQVKPGDVFSRKALTETSKKVGERLGAEGYAFANINAIPTTDKEKHEVAFNFVVDPGRRVYIRRINISGNTRTQDEVIRREFRQFEGAWFDGDKIKKSNQRVDKLDFFSEVNIETPTVQGTSDQMDVNMAVKEKNTGSISVGGGFSSGEGIVLSAGVTQANLFGSGNYLSTQISTSRINRVYALSFTNPYYTDDGVSRGFDLYKRDVNATSASLSQFTSNTSGAGIRFGVPIKEDESISYGLTAERTTLGLTPISPARYATFIDTFGATTSTLSSTVGWTRDTRDSAIDTTQGTVQRAVAEVALPVLDLHYYKLSYEHQWFYPVKENVVLLLNGQVGVGGGYSGQGLPFFKNLYAGGIGSVRGYDTNSLGPRDINDLSLGGTRRIVGSSELFIPFPGMSKEKAVRLSGFVDGGAVYGPGDLPGTVGFRFSTGLAVTWVSPVGPLKLSYGVPLNKQNGDKLQQFQFTLGNIF